VLYEAGINGMTIKEIAKRQNISEPDVYRHYKKKSEIIKEIFKRYSIYDEVITNTIFENKMVGKDGIRYFCRVIVEYYQNYPEITTVMFSFDLFKYDEKTNERMKNNVKNRYDLLFGLVAKAIEIKKLVLIKDAQVITDSIFSVLWGTIFLWRMENCSFELKERIILAVDNIIDF